MQAFLTELYAHASGPFFSAMLLGLLTAMAPCPMTINITAIGFIGRKISDRRKIFLNGIFYTLGTVISYTVLALVLYFGADRFRISSVFQQYSEMIIGPLLFVVGILMLGVININFPLFHRLTGRFQSRVHFRHWDAFLLGITLALAFCPFIGVFYFGRLVPLAVSASAPWVPPVFSFTAALPVVLFAWLLAFTVSGVGKLYHRLKKFEYWFSKLVAIIFIGIGIYYILVTWLL